MSTIQVVTPGDVVILDPSEQRVIAFDWDRNLKAGVKVTTNTFTLTAVRQVDATEDLSKDSEDTLSASEATTALERTVTGDDRVTVVRLNATTGNRGDLYILENVIVTDESPAQTKAASVRALIQDR